MTTIPQKVKELFADEMSAKFIATQDKDKIPNIAMISSTTSWEDEYLIFGSFLMWQTQKNLENNSPVTVSIMTEDLQSFEIRGTFQGFESSGDKFDFMSNKDIFRYSAIGLLRKVGVIKVNKISPIHLNSLSVGREWITAKIFAKRPRNLLDTGVKINRVVVRNIKVLKGAKFLAVSRNNHLEQFPVMGLKPCVDYLCIRPDLPLNKGETVAISSLNMDLKVFQIKGEFSGVQRIRGMKFGLIKVTKVISQTPPLVSKEIKFDN